MDNANIKTLYVTNKRDWRARAWLEKHFDTEPEVWLVFPKKASVKACISYNDVLEEALCFGWIDSKVRAHKES